MFRRYGKDDVRTDNNREYRTIIVYSIAVTSKSAKDLRPANSRMGK